MLLSAALKIKDESCKPDGFIIFPCVRHGFGYSTLHDLVGTKYHQRDIVEGFIDTNGKFYDRVDAYEYVMFHGQLSASTRALKREKGETELYSEDLY